MFDSTSKYTVEMYADTNVFDHVYSFDMSAHYTILYKKGKPCMTQSLVSFYQVCFVYIVVMRLRLDSMYGHAQCLQSKSVLLSSQALCSEA